MKKIITIILSIMLMFNSAMTIIAEEDTSDIADPSFEEKEVLEETAFEEDDQDVHQQEDVLLLNEGSEDDDSVEVYQDVYAEDEQQLQPSEELLEEESEPSAETQAEDLTVLDTGSCGANVTYTLYSDYSLVISGTGAMYNYTSSDPGYIEYGELSSVVIENGVTSVGKHAFHNIYLQFNKLASIVISDSVTEIGDYAFFSCPNITSLTMPLSASVAANSFAGVSGITSLHLTSGTGTGYNYSETTYKYTPWYLSRLHNIDVQMDEGITSIGTYTFKDCTGLSYLVLPSSLRVIDSYAFNECVGLSSIFVPSSVDRIGQYAFTNVYEIYTNASKKKNSWNTLWCDENTIVHYSVSEDDYYGELGDDYSIAFDGNGSTSGSMASMNSLVCGTVYTLKPNAFTRKGYVFTGWNTKADGSGTSFEDGQEVKNLSLNHGSSITMYAQWSPISYTVRYHSNSDVPSTYEQSFEYDRTQKLMGMIFDNEGLELKGWNTLANGAGRSYGLNEEVVNLSETQGSIITLYAQWEYPTAAPYADPEPGLVEKGTEVFLYCDTPDSSIYYTLDGSLPSRDSSLYDKEITIEDDTTIRAFAVSKDLSDSKAVTLRYLVADDAEYSTIDPEDAAWYEELGEPEGFWTSPLVYDIEDPEREIRYTGKPITLSFRVYDGVTLLEQNKDYTIKYANNTKAALHDSAKAPSVTITGKGNYVGTLTKTFDILPAQLDEENCVTVLSKDTFIANGKVQKPAVTLEYNGVKLKNNTDYTVFYEDGQSKEEGVYSLSIDGVNNYEGHFEASYRILGSSSPLKPVSSLKYSSIKALTYSGQELFPELTVKDGKTLLEEGEHYTLEYSDNLNAGTAYITITGIEEAGYTGTSVKSFRINPIKLSSKNCEVLGLETAYDFDPDGPVVPDTLLACDGSGLMQDEDYELVLKNNDKAGTATITYKGMNNYSGSFSKSFKINKLELDESIFDFDPAYDYLKGGVKPIPNSDLVYNRDYTLSYKNNKKVGEATVTVKGKGNYTGSLVYTFEIISKFIEEVNISASDRVYSTKPGAFRSSPVLTDKDGKKLTAGTDYEKQIEYECDGRTLSSSDVLESGSIVTATVTGKGNYEGSASTTYRIVDADISKAKVTIPAQYYTGRPITLAKKDITITLNKQVLKLSDYDIVSYENNTAKGTAKLTIKGKGNYGGTKTVTFKIVQKSLGMTIKFNPNGATSGSMKDQMIYKDTKLSKNTFKRIVGGVTHEFLGFNTKYDGSGDWYQPGDLFPYDPDKAGTFVILWAQWE